MPLLGRHETLKRINDFEALPSVPQIIARVREISEDPQSSVADLANIILSDHALTARILKIANSAFYAEFANKVSTVTQAITLMGFRTVQNVIISLALFDSMQHSARHHKFDFRQFWTKSLSTGVIAKMIATASHYKVPEEAFIAGFMHDIGIAVLAMIFPEEYDVVLKRVDRGEEYLAAEKSIFGIDHTEVGGWLARKWNLPPLLSRPVTDHHRQRLPARQKSNNPVVDIVFLSDLTYEVIYSRQDEAVIELERSARDLTGIEPEVITKIIEHAPELISEIAGEFDIVLKAPDGREPSPVKEALDREAMEMVQRLNARNREMAIMHETSDAIKQAANEDELLQTTLEEVFRGMGLGRALLLQVDDDAKVARGILGFGVNSQQSVYEMVFPLADGIIGRTVTEVEAQNVFDASAEVYAEQLTQEEKQYIGTCAFATLPMEVEGKVEFVMVLNNPDPGDPLDDDRLRSISSIISQASLGVERVRLRKQLAELRGEEVDGLVDTAMK